MNYEKLFIYQHISITKCPKKSAVRPQPAAMRAPIRAPSFHMPLKPGRMVHFQEMRQLMNHDIIDDPLRSHYNAPVKIKVALDGTASPQTLLVLDPDLIGAHAHLSAPMGDSFCEFLPGFPAQGRLSGRAGLPRQPPRLRRGKNVRELPA